uniref:ribosomal protein S4 n=1 Tax=Paralagenidium karlingii TaxID=1440115 RepID=UPI0026E15068|nr:ribosomal protein S4 [Paralagenidium karlingii]WJH17922.1 ribosomal protein S4 [Paralagenidium karlingii]
MNKLNPRNKQCLNKNRKPHLTLNLFNLRKKKWKFFKRNVFRMRKNSKQVERREHFFQRRLAEKQQFKYSYGCLPEYQLKNLYKKFKNKTNNINFFKNVVLSLEKRLDIVVLRLRLAKTVFHAKQLINHGKIKVNNKIVTYPNFLVKAGDSITNTCIKPYLKKKLKKSPNS